MPDPFTQFEHEGWERVANRYDSTWSSLTRQFIPHLIAAAKIEPGTSVLDVACGPGYVADAVTRLGAQATGVDFSKAMVAIAKKMFPEITFIEGDAQNLPQADNSFDRILTNFGLLHLAQPEKACAEAFRVLKPGGRFGFSVWGESSVNPGGKIVNDAIEAHADMSVPLPKGPPDQLFSDKKECRKILQSVGFGGGSFDTHLVNWNVPSTRYLFEAERDHGVRTAGVLARQNLENLRKIKAAIEEGVGRYAKNDQFAIPMAAHIVTVVKKA